MTDQLYCPECGPEWHGAYNLDHRCVTCGAVLRVEKVMERLKAVEEDRDALAAHVERISGLAHPVVGLCQACLEEDDDVEALLEALEEEPTTSLARLKAQWQAAILHKACNEGWWGSTLRHKAFELEEQAGVARMSTEAHQLDRRRQAEGEP